jgi:hypothetical protein
VPQNIDEQMENDPVSIAEGVLRLAAVLGV